MNAKKLSLIIIITVIAVALLIVGSAAAKASESTFNCSNNEEYETTDPGSWSFPDGNIHIRGMKQTARVVCDDTRLIGYNDITVNANWDANFTGPMWGKFTFRSDEGGIFKGTWNGMMTADGSWYNAVGNGSGEYEGLKLWIDKEIDQTTGRILNPMGD